MEEQNIEKEGGVGAIFGTIIVMALLIAGGFYFYSQNIEKQKKIDEQNKTEQILSTSDEIDALTEEASSTNFDNLGEGIDNL